MTIYTDLSPDVVYDHWARYAAIIHTEQAGEMKTRQNES